MIDAPTKKTHNPHIQHLKASDRGLTRMGGLHSAHSFSFGHWYDPQRLGFSDLRVLNDDQVAADGGFPPHPHANMEILSYVLAGALTHQDSMGNSHTMTPGSIQIMSAGSGVTHSEVNPSPDAPVHFLQIWIETNQRGAEPRYGQAKLDECTLKNGFVTIAGSGSGSDVPIRQDARVLAAWPEHNKRITTELDQNRAYYLHVASGTVRAEGYQLGAGDALTLEQANSLAVTSIDNAQVLLFDLRARQEAA